MSRLSIGGWKREGARASSRNLAGRHFIKISWVKELDCKVKIKSGQKSDYSDSESCENIYWHALLINMHACMRANCHG